MDKSKFLGVSLDIKTETMVPDPLRDSRKRRSPLGIRDDDTQHVLTKICRKTLGELSVYENNNYLNRPVQPTKKTWNKPVFEMETTNTSDRPVKSTKTTWNQPVFEMETRNTSDIVNNMKAYGANNSAYSTTKMFETDKENRNFISRQTLKNKEHEQTYLKITAHETVADQTDIKYICGECQQSFSSGEKMTSHFKTCKNIRWDVPLTVGFNNTQTSLHRVPEAVNNDNELLVNTDRDINTRKVNSDKDINKSKVNFEDLTPVFQDSDSFRTTTITSPKQSISEKNPTNEQQPYMAMEELYACRFDTTKQQSTHESQYQSKLVNEDENEPTSIVNDLELTYTPSGINYINYRHQDRSQSNLKMTESLPRQLIFNNEMPVLVDERFLDKDSFFGQSSFIDRSPPVLVPERHVAINEEYKHLSDHRDVLLPNRDDKSNSANTQNETEVTGNSNDDQESETISNIDFYHEFNTKLYDQTEPTEKYSKEEVPNMNNHSQEFKCKVPNMNHNNQELRCEVPNKNNNNQNFKCKKCSVIFSTPLCYLNHLIMNHYPNYEKQNFIKCPCSKWNKLYNVYNNNSLKSHLQSSHDYSETKCFSCKMEFTNFPELHKHLQECGSGELIGKENNLQCQRCRCMHVVDNKADVETILEEIEQKEKDLDKMTENDQTYDEQYTEMPNTPELSIKLQYGKQPTGNVTKPRTRHEVAEDIKERMWYDGKWFLCSLCYAQFHQYVCCKDHMLKVHSSNFTYPPGSEVFQCPMCDSIFHNTHFLKKHLTEFHAVSKFQCNKCRSKFNCQEEYNLHQKYCKKKITQNFNKRISCLHCGIIHCCTVDNGEYENIMKEDLLRKSERAEDYRRKIDFMQEIKPTNKNDMNSTTVKENRSLTSIIAFDKEHKHRIHENVACLFCNMKFSHKQCLSKHYNENCPSDVLSSLRKLSSWI